MSQTTNIEDLKNRENLCLGEIQRHCRKYGRERFSVQPVNEFYYCQRGICSSFSGLWQDDTDIEESKGVIREKVEYIDRFTTLRFQYNRDVVLESERGS